MARAMFQHTITVLEKVSFDLQLFSKEVEKAFKRLLPHEVEELKIFIKSLIDKEPHLASLSF